MNYPSASCCPLPFSAATDGASGLVVTVSGAKLIELFHLRIRAFELELAKADSRMTMLQSDIGAKRKQQPVARVNDQDLAIEVAPAVQIASIQNWVDHVKLVLDEIRWSISIIKAEETFTLTVSDLRFLGFGQTVAPMPNLSAMNAMPASLAL